MLRLFVTALLLSAVTGFAPLPALKSTAVAPSISTTARFIILNEEETAAILRTAEECAEHSQCTVEDVAGLMNELKEMQATMETRMKKLNQMIEYLDQTNKKQERKTDEVRQFVKDMLRVFAHEGGGFPTGFSGDIGDGPTTAYDALPPKKWKPSS